MSVILSLQTHPSARPWVSLSLLGPFPLTEFGAQPHSFKGSQPCHAQACSVTSSPERPEPALVSRHLVGEVWGHGVEPILKFPKRHGKTESKILRSKKKEEQNNGNQKKISVICLQVSSSAVNPWFISHAIGLHI